MTKSHISLMLEIMNHKRGCGTERDADSKYYGMLEMFSQLVCIEDRETCEEVIDYFITNDKVSGEERTNFSETVVSFNYFIENYEKAINDAFIINNVNAQVMLDVFKVFRNSMMMNVVFYKRFGTKADYWNACLSISEDDYRFALNDGNAVCSKIGTDVNEFTVAFDDDSKLLLVMKDNFILAHSVIN